MTQRYTERMLRDTVDEINKRLRDEGSIWRFHWSPRNGYQAVDRYEVKEGQGDEYKGQGVYNVGCGTPREVNTYCWQEYRSLSD